MALYVAVCTLAALAAVGEDAGHGQVRAFALVWGTTLGLALAHSFAFQLSARVAAGGSFRRSDAESAIAQLAGAAFVAVLVSIPVVVLPVTSEYDAARLVLALFIGGTGYVVARLAGRTRARSLLYSVLVLIAAVAVALAKNLLSHH